MGLYSQLRAARRTRAILMHDSHPTQRSDSHCHAITDLKEDRDQVALDGGTDEPYVPAGLSGLPMSERREEKHALKGQDAGRVPQGLRANAEMRNSQRDDFKAWASLATFTPYDDEPAYQAARAGWAACRARLVYKGRSQPLGAFRSDRAC